MTRTAGRGWATVELERAEAEVQRVIGSDLRFSDTDRSRLLGAQCRRAETADGEWIVLLEPDTEGRVAGFLASHGEGWAATWARSESPDPTGMPVAGPLGPELLAPDQPLRGPFRLVLTAATIEA
jgi:hypothetical protein